VPAPDDRSTGKLSVPGHRDTGASPRTEPLPVLAPAQALAERPWLTRWVRLDTGIRSPAKSSLAAGVACRPFRSASSPLCTPPGRNSRNRHSGRQPSSSCHSRKPCAGFSATVHAERRPKPICVRIVNHGMVKTRQRGGEDETGLGGSWAIRRDRPRAHVWTSRLLL